MNRTIKTTAVVSIVSLVCIFVLSCSDSGTATVSINLNLPKNAAVLKSVPDTIIDRVLRLFSSAAYAAPAGVTEIAIVVTGPGLSPFEGKYPADTEKVVLAVEAGKDRTFVLKAYNSAGEVIYGGSATVDLKNGEMKDLVIYMRVPLRMMDINSQPNGDGGTYSSSPDELTPFNKKVYFSADDGTNGRELWMLDPASDSMQQVTNIASGSLSSDPTDLTVYGDELYFVASDQDIYGYGRELWHINRANVVQTPFDIWLNNGSSIPTNLTVLDGKLFFSANGDDGINQYGIEPYVYDGTIDPQLIRNIFPGYDSSDPVGFAFLNGSVYFMAHDDSGYYVYEFIEPGNAPGIDGFDIAVQPGNSSPVLFNKRLNYSMWTDSGTYLYAFNGTEIFEVSNVDLIDAANQENLTVLGDNLYFPARDAGSGIELWSYNGVYPAELVIDIMNITDINPGTGDSSPDAICVINGLLYFGAYAGGEVTYLYSYNPNTSGSTPVLPALNGIADIRKVGNVIAYLDAPDQGSGSVWIYDPVKPVVEGTNPHSVTDTVSIDQILLVQGNRIYLSGNDGNLGTELWIYDYYE